MFKHGALFCLISLSLAGCRSPDSTKPPGWDEAAGVYHGGSNFPSTEAFLEAGRHFVLKKAKFELNCDTLTATKLAGQHVSSTNRARWDWGVEGCEQRATYVSDCFSNWGDITCNTLTNTVSKPAS